MLRHSEFFKMLLDPPKTEDSFVEFFCVTQAGTPEVVYPAVYVEQEHAAQPWKQHCFPACKTALVMLVTH